MNQYDQGLQAPQGTMADAATAEDRGRFIVNTYMHLAGAIVVFALLEAFLLSWPPAVQFAGTMLAVPAAMAG